MPETRSQKLNYPSTDGEVVKPEREETNDARVGETSSITPVDIVNMLKEQREILESQRNIQQDFICEMREWRCKQEAVVEKLRSEFTDEIGRAYRKINEFKEEVYERIECVSKGDTQTSKDREDRILTIHAQMLASTHENLKQEVKADILEEINYTIEKRLESIVSPIPKRFESHPKARLSFEKTSTASKPCSSQPEMTKRALPNTPTLRGTSRPTQRPTAFDGKTSWDAYKTQFEIVAEINRWNDEEKAAFLATSLQGQAVSVLNCLSQTDRRDYNALVQALESRYGTLCQSELNRATLRNRVRRRDEGLPELSADIERLVRLAYPNGTAEMLEALAKDQFIDAVQDDDIRLRIAQGRPMTLRAALEIALELESFALANKRRSRFVRKCFVDETHDSPADEPWVDVAKQLRRLTQEMRNFAGERGVSSERRRGGQTSFDGCWTCGGNHFQRDCPQYGAPRADKRASGDEDEVDVKDFYGRQDVERGSGEPRRSKDGRGQMDAPDGRMLGIYMLFR